jgi:hypothetical protein
MSTTTTETATTAAQLPAGQNAPKLGKGISTEELGASQASQAGRRPRTARSTAKPAAAKPAAPALAPARRSPVPVGPKMKCADRAVAIAEYLADHHATSREDLAATMNCSAEVIRYMTTGSGDGAIWTTAALAERGYTAEQDKAGKITVTVIAKRSPRKR